MKILNTYLFFCVLLTVSLLAGCSGGRRSLSQDIMPSVSATTPHNKPNAVAATAELFQPDSSISTDTSTASDDFGIDSLIEESQNDCQRNDFHEAHVLLKKAVASIKAIDESTGEWTESEDYYKEIANVYTNSLPQQYMDSIPEEVSLLIFQDQLANSVDSQNVSAADSALLQKILNEKSVTYDLPIVWNERVSRSLAYLSRGGKGSLTRWLAHAQYYVPTIKKMFADSGLPTDLSYLPLIESGFNLRAYSRARASGMWQFIASTGTRYGLQNDCWVDERRDFLRSTQAAVSYLKKLYTQFNDWHIAIGSYNCGENGMACAINRAACKDYWSLRLPGETMGYVPQFLAAVILAKNPEYIGADTQSVQTYNLDTILVTDCINLHAIADTLGISSNELHAINPHILHWCTHPQKSIILYLPHGTKDHFLAAYNMSPADFLVSWQTYQTTRQGETIRSIARKFRVPSEAMASLNSISANEGLDAGIVLSLPVALNQNNDNAIINPLNLGAASDDEDSGRRIKVRYKVKRGDNVSSIAHKYHISSSDLCSWNHISSRKKLSRGTVLTLYRTPVVSHASARVAAASKGVIRYKVKRGENLASIADKFNISVKQLRTWNKRSTRRSVHAGAVLAIYSGTTDNNTSTDTESASQSKIKKSVQKTKSTSPTNHVTVYTIKKGDNLWAIARAFKIPAKRIALFNDISVRSRLIPGTILKVPHAEAL